MGDLSEVKKHVKDEHLREGTKHRLKRIFAADTSGDHASQGESRMRSLEKIMCLCTYSRTHFANISFEDELDLYGLLEADADGEDDPDVGFHPSTEDILIGRRSYILAPSIQANNHSCTSFRCLTIVLSTLDLCLIYTFRRPISLITILSSRQLQSVAVQIKI